MDLIKVDIAQSVSSSRNSQIASSLKETWTRDTLNVFDESRLMRFDKQESTRESQSFVPNLFTERRKREINVTFN